MLGLNTKTITNAQLAAKHEVSASEHIPFSYHYDKHTICNHDGTMFQVIKLEGIAYETTDRDTIIHEKESRNMLLSTYSDEFTGIYTYTIRREESTRPEGEYKPGSFTEELNEAYCSLNKERKAYINDHYMVIMRRPHISGARGGLMRLVQALSKKAFNNQVDIEYLERCEQLGRIVGSVITGINSYTPRLLSVNEIDGHYVSGPLGFLYQLINHQTSKIVLPKMDLSHYLTACRTIFGPEAIEIRYPTHTRFAAIVSVKEYGNQTDAGMLDQLLRLPIEITLAQSFLYVDKQKALESIDRARKYIKQSDDFAQSQGHELEQALDDLQSGKLAVGEHSLNILIFADSLKQLNKNIDTIAGEIQTLHGIIAVREDTNLEHAYWSFLPGNTSYIHRGSEITTQNFAGFASFHNQPAGQKENNHWGPCVSVLSTKAGTPYFFNFHQNDLGHTLIAGPSGRGKTLLVCFLLAQAMKYKPRMIYLDYRRGAEIFIRSINGSYHTVSPQNKTGWNPLLLDDTPENHAFLEDWLSMLLTTHDDILSADDRDKIKKAIDGNYSLPKEKRRLEIIKPFLGAGSIGSLSHRLTEWCGDGSRAYLFDNNEDSLDMKAGVCGFDMTHLLDDDIGRTPAFAYLYHRIKQSLDGYPTIIPIDETWAYFDTEYFSLRLKEELKITRRLNAFFIMSTNDVADATKTEISSTIIAQTATNIFFANHKADPEEYKQFGLSDKEIDLIKTENESNRYFLLKQGNQSAMVRLDLSGLERFIPILSCTQANALKLEQIINRVGDNPELWVPLLINNDKEKTICAA